MNIEKLSEEELKDIKRAFTIFMTKLVRYSRIDFIRKETLKNSRIVPLEEGVVKKVSLSNYDSGTFFIDNYVKGNKIDKLMSKEEHRKAISRLSKREKQIIKLLYIDEKDIEEIARELNITEKTVSNTKNSALDKLRNDMEE